MPGSSPTMARREPTRRLNSVDLPTLGRPTMAMSGAPVELEEDEVKIIRERVEAGALTGLAARRAGFCQRQFCRVSQSGFARPGGRGPPPLHQPYKGGLFFIGTPVPLRPRPPPPPLPPTLPPPPPQL